jgi:hypothetical protein
VNVTLRPNGIADVYIQTLGEACTLADLEKQIRALLVARAWLRREMKGRETKPEKKPAK